MSAYQQVLAWAAVIVPTAAVMWVYRQQERTRRYLARPIVVVHWDHNPGTPFTRVRLELANESNDVVNIDKWTVVAGGEIIKWEEPHESPANYWRRVLDAASDGFLRVQRLEGCVIAASRSISGKSSLLLVDAYVAGQPDTIQKALDAIEIREHSRSASGETAAFSHRYRGVKPLKS